MKKKLFIKTLSNGEKLLNQMLQKSQNHLLNGEDAFKLYDTYGSIRINCGNC